MTESENIRRLFDSQLAPREHVMDGELHYATDDCCDDECRKCGRRAHMQPVYGAIEYACEHCDAAYWWPSGSYRALSDRWNVEPVRW